MQKFVEGKTSYELDWKAKSDDKKLRYIVGRQAYNNNNNNNNNISGTAEFIYYFIFSVFGVLGIL